LTGETVVAVKLLLGMTIFVVDATLADIWAFEMFNAFRSSEFL